MENINVITQGDPIGDSQTKGGIKADATIVQPADSKHEVAKVIVAVHGIGDQNAYGTLQQVVNQFCVFHDQPAAIPLGSFHEGHRRAAFSMPDLFPKGEFKDYAFAEVYWAKIPRKVVSEQHTLEEAKAWAATIVERLRLLWRKNHESDDFEDVNFAQLKLVLSELIETIAILERLCFLADKAGLFTFDLKKLLDDYLGDVQIVAEFQPDRDKILRTFKAVMYKVHEAYEDAEIYVIAHSEGTVISFLGLLQAASQAKSPKWLSHVKGFMTIGSPIDKHLILWPSLFPTRPERKNQVHASRINWYNYYDKGDPIGFELNDARQWIIKQGWDSLFNFPQEQDFGFTRYPLPGKAHVDYWTDKDVFGHFIENVINQPVTKSEEPRFPNPPKDKFVATWLSLLLPYIGVFVLLTVGVFILFKAIFGLNPGVSTHQNDRFLFDSVGGTAILMFGFTVVTRIPRLTRGRKWLAVAWMTYLISILVHWYWLPQEVAIEKWLLSQLPFLRDYFKSGSSFFDSLRILLTTGAVFMISWFHKNRPVFGTKPLMVSSAIGLAIFVLFYVNTSKNNDGPVWPVIIAAAAFFYLWWLAILIFDLVFVWHVHIRNSLSMVHMDEVINSGARKQPKSIFD